MASQQPSSKTPLYPSVLDSNPDSLSPFVSSSSSTSTPSLYPPVSVPQPSAPPSSSSSSLYPTIDMNDLTENLFPGSPPDVSSSAPPPVEDTLLAVPGAILHLIDRQRSVELASGDLSILGIRQGDSEIAAFACVGSVQWPLARDSPSVKLDSSHYFFSLPLPADADDPESTILNYGLTFASKGQEKRLEELDRLLEHYTSFSVQEVKTPKKGGEVLDGSVAKEVAPAEMVAGPTKEMMEERSAAYWTTLAPNVEDYSGSMAKVIAVGSGMVIKGILWCGDVTVDRLKWGDKFMKKRMGPNDKPSEISKDTMKRIKRVKRVTKMSEKVANGVLSGVVKVSGYVTSSVINSKVGKKFFNMLPGEVVLASLEGFGKICDAVEVAGKNVLSTSSVVTTGLVSHRYGDQAGEMTKESLDAGGHAIGTAWAVFKIRKALDPKSAVKPTTLAKSAVKAAAADLRAKQSKESRTSFTPHQRMLHGDTAAEEEFNFHNTRCLSSYYSIFVARLAIMVMLAILIGMLTMLTWHFTRTYTTNSITSLAYGLRYELLQRPILRMWNILNSTVEITVAQVKLSEYVISQHEQPKRHGQVELYEAMRNITWALFASKKALDAITINYTNGFVQAFHRDRRSNNTYYIYSDLINATNTQIQGSPGNHSEVARPTSQNLSAVWYREPLDPTTGNKLGVQRQIAPEDLIKIAGLSELRDGTASWHVAVGKFTESPLLSAALPVRHPSQGNIVAVVGVTTALKSVGQLMRELVEFHSGYMYLTSKDGYLLATSTDAPLLRNTTTGLKLMMANDSDNQMIKSGAEWLWRTYGDKFPISHEVHAENVMLGHERYYIDSFFLNLKRLPLVGVIIIPRKYIMGKVDQIGFTTLIILISASICILAIGCVCILILTSGVSKAMKLRAELISQLDARRRAEASSNYKSQFLANMSHELRTPMAAVIGLLDILMIDDNLTNEQVATVTQIRKCSTALLRLLNNILDLSKVESGKLVLEEAEFDLGRELEGLVDMFSVHSMSHNVETILDLCDSMPKVVRGDSARVVQIFTNLISNSIKFTSEQHGDNKMLQDALNTKSKQNENTVKRDCKKNEKITLWFEVEDTGCGIDPSKWETVFESFEQADPSTTRTHGGTGLGLCIVRNLVNKMGGEIKVAKKEGPGTLMQLYLVLGMAEFSQETKKDLSKYNLTVLLAMNNSKGRSITMRWLREKGVSTWEASEWNGLTKILLRVFRGNSNAQNGLTEHPKRETIGLNGMSEVAKETDARNTYSSKVVIVVDTGLLDQSTNIWKEQLIFLDRYHGEAKFAWVLSHDTSNAIKVELRRRGNFLMVNKPLYKTKLIQILESVVSQENFEEQGGGNSELSTIPSEWSECHEIDPLQFDSISSESSGISDTENLGSRTRIFPVEDKTREELPVSHNPHYWKSNSGKESVNSIAVHNPTQKSKNIQAENDSQTLSRGLTGADKHGCADGDHSVRYSHKKAAEENVPSEKARQTQDTNPQQAVDPLLTYKRTFCELNQLDYLKRNLIEETNQHHTDAQSCEPKDREVELTDKRNSETVCNLHTRRLQNQNGEQQSTLSSRALEFNKYQDTNFQMNKEDCSTPTKVVPHQNHLGGLCILLAEDNPILQRVAMTMLEKVGAKVVAVGDGMQAVDALKCMSCAEQNATQNSIENDGERQSPKPLQENPPFDLILMDCQMPKLDGYEATKAIRRLEEGTSLHIPIVAVTAHAMLSDEEKCLKVGMDAYLTKPIDCKLMVSTILSLTKKNANVNNINQMAAEQRS
ncbi:hypothetical protein J5N97_023919 [Dioscorea zingiberensis]|uniref:histidine kinase n=1 Tax=Dioscorea zingiberensis TaxID=325984 RepID=A0A9D5C6N3_9LILI|nr:hypothetical protein J5N97_023919 [Dioscorea zingiberensis]